MMRSKNDFGAPAIQVDRIGRPVLVGLVHYFSDQSAMKTTLFQRVTVQSPFQNMTGVETSDSPLQSFVTRPGQSIPNFPETDPDEDPEVSPGEDPEETPEDEDDSSGSSTGEMLGAVAGMLAILGALIVVGKVDNKAHPVGSAAEGDVEGAAGDVGPSSGAAVTSETAVEEGAAIAGGKAATENPFAPEAAATTGSGAAGGAAAAAIDASDAGQAA